MQPRRRGVVARRRRRWSCAAAGRGRRAPPPRGRGAPSCCCCRCRTRRGSSPGPRPAAAMPSHSHPYSPDRRSKPAGVSTTVCGRVADYTPPRVSPARPTAGERPGRRLAVVQSARAPIGRPASCGVRLGAGGDRPGGCSSAAVGSARRSSLPACGRSGAVGGAAPHFVDDTPASGIDHRYDGEFEYFVGGGVAAFDCDDDGRDDLFLAGGTAAGGALPQRQPDRRRAAVLARRRRPSPT